MAMDSDDIRAHIVSAAGPSARRLAARMFGVCWPGGATDRTAPIARLWFSQWRPAKSAVSVPVCSCSSGHCTVCN
jgi:hypothetical protein